MQLWRCSKERLLESLGNFRRACTRRAQNSTMTKLAVDPCARLFARARCYPGTCGLAGNDDVAVTVGCSNIVTPAKTKHATANAARMMVAALLSNSASRMHISSEAMDIDGRKTAQGEGCAMDPRLRTPLREYFITSRKGVAARLLNCVVRPSRLEYLPPVTRPAPRRRHSLDPGVRAAQVCRDRCGAALRHLAQSGKNSFREWFNTDSVPVAMSK